jgi:DNA-binding LytR/AlgR family response regulator
VAVARHGARARVFVTAYDQYAIQAFETGAVDYVLKPYTDERLAVTIERLKAKLASPPQDLNAIVSQLATQLRGGARRRSCSDQGELRQNLRLIPVDEVLFFQSDEKYTRVVTADLEALIKTPIRELMDGLDPEVFWQIHRSTLVNASAIAGVTRDFRGQAHVKVKGKDEVLTVSRIYSHLFKQILLPEPGSRGGFTCRVHVPGTAARPGGSLQCCRRGGPARPGSANLAPWASRNN